MAATKKKTVAESDDDVFRYTTTSGELIELPHPANHLSAGFMRKNRKVEEEELGWRTLEFLADEETLEKIDALSYREFMVMITEMYQEMQITPGESGAS